ncbi:MAG TPA: hypothetical protein VM889_01185 [Candidatus Thermoplasmatota archaeon]|nr:hypothetical protein [Candidatus Thermoplasmatota archaeon]
MSARLPTLIIVALLPAAGCLAISQQDAGSGGTIADGSGSTAHWINATARSLSLIVEDKGAYGLAHESGNGAVQYTRINGLNVTQTERLLPLAGGERVEWIEGDFQGGWAAYLVSVVHEGSGGVTERRISAMVRKPSERQWHRIEIPANSLHSSASGPVSFALAPDGTAYALVFSIAPEPALTLVTIRGKEIQSESIGPPSFGSVAVDTEGKARVCHSDRQGNVIERTPGGKSSLIHTGNPGESYLCVFAILSDGSAKAAFVAPPALGSSCLIYDLCTGSVTNQRYMLGDREANGSWNVASSTIPLHGMPQLSETPDGRVYFQNPANEHLVVYQVEALTASVVRAMEYRFPFSTPRSNGTTPAWAYQQIENQTIVVEPLIPA